MQFKADITVRALQRRISDILGWNALDDENPYRAVAKLYVVEIGHAPASGNKSASSTLGNRSLVFAIFLIRDAAKPQHFKMVGCGQIS
jgi:hypothetical protein